MSISTIEVEYLALIVVIKEMLWLSYILRDLYISIDIPVNLFCDKSTLLIAKNLCIYG